MTQPISPFGPTSARAEVQVASTHALTESGNEERKMAPAPGTVMVIRLGQPTAVQPQPAARTEAKEAREVRVKRARSELVLMPTPMAVGVPA